MEPSTKPHVPPMTPELSAALWSYTPSAPEFHELETPLEDALQNQLVIKQPTATITTAVSKMEADGLLEAGREFKDQPMPVARVYFFFSDYGGKKFINGLQVEAPNGARGARHSKVQDNCPYSVLELAPGERITQIRGYVEDPAGLVYLEFWTVNNPSRKQNPIHIGGQSEDGAPFTRVILPEGYDVVGFHGVYGNHIKSIGVFVAEPAKPQQLSGKTLSWEPKAQVPSAEADQPTIQADPTIDLKKVEKTTHYGVLDGREFSDVPLRIKRVIMYIEAKMVVGIQVETHDGRLGSAHGKSQGRNVGVSQLVLKPEEYITNVQGGTTNNGLVWIRFTVAAVNGATKETVKHFGGQRGDDTDEYSMYIKSGNVVVGFHGTKTMELKSLGVLHYPHSMFD